MPFAAGPPPSYNADASPHTTATSFGRAFAASPPTSRPTASTCAPGAEAAACRAQPAHRQPIFSPAPAPAPPALSIDVAASRRSVPSPTSESERPPAAVSPRASTAAQLALAHSEIAAELAALRAPKQLSLPRSRPPTGVPMDSAASRVVAAWPPAVDGARGAAAGSVPEGSGQGCVCAACAALRWRRCIAHACDAVAERDRERGLTQ